MGRPKITIIGSGQIGGVLAYHATSRKLGDIVIYDVVPGRPQGKALDISAAAREDEFDLRIIGTNDYADIKGSNVVVITAGVPRKPGMSRDDLIGVNSKIMRDVSDGIVKYAPDAHIICVSNPLDAMVTLCQRYTGFPHHRVMGMAGVLDSSRFATFIAWELGYSVRDVNATVLGGHGDSMVPIVRFANINGIPITELLISKYKGDKDKAKSVMDGLVARTQGAGGEVVKLLKDGSAFFSPASSIISMTEAILQDQKRLMTACAYLTGQFNVYGYYVGVPCVIGAGGVEQIIEFSLTPEEQKMFDTSVASVKELVDSLP